MYQPSKRGVITLRLGDSSACQMAPLTCGVGLGVAGTCPALADGVNLFAHALPFFFVAWIFSAVAGHDLVCSVSHSWPLESPISSKLLALPSVIPFAAQKSSRVPSLIFAMPRRPRRALSGLKPLVSISFSL